MNYMNVSLKWEEVFFQEALILEEKMASLDLDDLNKSRLRIAFEENILNWQKYSEWLFAKGSIKSLQSNITTNFVEKLKSNARETYKRYSHHAFWNEDLIPVAIWDNQIIVLGLSYNENLAELSNCIFLLAAPSLLSQISSEIFSRSATASHTAKDYVSESTSSNIDADLLQGIDLNARAPLLDFKSKPITAALTQNEDEGIWEYLSERHDEYCFEAKKHFSAYAVLRIKNDKTFLYKMDSELQQQLPNTDLFHFNLSDKNIFTKVYQSGVSESFNLSQLNITVANYKYLCVTALKRGPKTIGFLLGFKSNQLAEKDQLLLEELAKESA